MPELGGCAADAGLGYLLGPGYGTYLAGERRLPDLGKISFLYVTPPRFMTGPLPNYSPDQC